MSELSDPRVLFAAERTLLAWSRTSLTLMGFGFLIERFCLFLHLFAAAPPVQLDHRGVSFWVGIIYIVLGTVVAVLATIQFQRVVRTLRPAEIPTGYWMNLGIFTNLALAALGIGLTIYLIYGFQ